MRGTPEVGRGPLVIYADAVESISNEVRIGPTDLGAAAMGERRLRDLYAQLDAVEDAVELRELLVDLQEEVDDCRELIGRSGRPDDLRELADLGSRAREAIRDQDSVTATAQLDRARQFFIELMRRSGHWDRTVFAFFHEERHKLVPTAEADSLIREGEQAIARQDWATLAGVNARLRLLRELVDCPSVQIR